MLIAERHLAIAGRLKEPRVVVLSSHVSSDDDEVFIFTKVGP